MNELCISIMGILSLILVRLQYNEKEDKKFWRILWIVLCTILTTVCIAVCLVNYIADSTIHSDNSSALLCIFMLYQTIPKHKKEKDKWKNQLLIFYSIISIILMLLILIF